jgi:hypothetical protein
MAHDLFFKNSPRSWSRGIEASSSGSHLFERREPTPLLIVRDKNSGHGWLGYALAATVTTRLVSGKRPWYWGQLAAKKIESKG